MIAIKLRTNNNNTKPIRQTLKQGNDNTCKGLIKRTLLKNNQINKRRGRSFSTDEKLLPSCLFDAPAAHIILPCLAKFIQQELLRNPHGESAFEKPGATPYDAEAPSIFEILSFLKKFHRIGKLTQCLIVGMAYLDRIKEKVKLHPLNWHRLLLVIFIVAEKSLVDEEIWNEDYLGIVDEILTDEINQLERQFLIEIQYQLALKTSDYGKYYFTLMNYHFEQRVKSKDANASVKLINRVMSRNRSYNFAK